MGYMDFACGTDDGLISVINRFPHGLSGLAALVCYCEGVYDAACYRKNR